jgi:hypothetical protein
VKTSTECERTRRQHTAWLDGESDPLPERDRQHLSACSSCRQWLADVEAMTARFQGVAYPDARIDLWPSVAARIGQAAPLSSVSHRLWPMGVLLLGWRALQLSVDLPVPALYLFAPLAAVIAIAFVTKVVGDPLTIQTWAPELRKGDV